MYSNVDGHLNKKRLTDLYQMVTKPTRSRLGQTANIIDLALVKNEFLITEIQHCCPLGKSDHQLLTLSIQLDCLFDRSIYVLKQSLIFLSLILMD